MKAVRRMVYATLLIGDGGQGGQTLFIHPVGNYMPALVGASYGCKHCGRYETPRLTLEHTNIMQAGQFGSAIGSAELFELRATTNDGTQLHSGRYALRVAGKLILGGPLYELMQKEAKPLPRVLVTRVDTFEFEVSFDGPIKRTPEQGNCLLKVEFWGDFLPCEPTGDVEHV